MSVEIPVLSVSEFVATLNQTLEHAYGLIRIEGEVSELRVSKNRWLYFNLQDEYSSVKFFGTVYHMRQPIEDGMVVRVSGTPRLHNRYGFSVNVQTITPSGEGDIKRAFELLKAKLEADGLFAPERKRALPRVPRRIGLITSAQSAAYADFIKILNQRWGGIEVVLADVQVQGEPAVGQIVRAIDYFNQMPEPVDVLVITRGGGSAEDLQAFSTEPVTRAVAGSRVPTLVGIGHEVDVSLAELVADMRAATPTNAAQIVVPDKRELQQEIDATVRRLDYGLQQLFSRQRSQLATAVTHIHYAAERPRRRVVELHESLMRLVGDELRHQRVSLENMIAQLNQVNPKRVLARGYSLVTNAEGVVVHDAANLKVGDTAMIEFEKGTAETEVKNVRQ